MLALKMVPAEQVCQEQGLQPGTPEFAACVEQETARQAELIQAIMVDEQAPDAAMTTAVEPYDQTILEPTPEEIVPQATLLPTPPELMEQPAHVEPSALPEQTEQLPAPEAVAIVTEQPAVEQTPTESPVPPVPSLIALQESITKTKQPHKTEPAGCEGQLTHAEFAAVDGCMATVEVNEHGEKLPTVDMSDCSPSAEERARL
jgi:hypothetical protein